MPLGVQSQSLLEAAAAKQSFATAIASLCGTYVLQWAALGTQLQAPAPMYANGWAHAHSTTLIACARTLALFY